MSYTDFPAFPEDIPTHPLLVIDYELIKARDPTEIDRLWDAATKLGFWYLKNHGVSAEVNGMFDTGSETLALPIEEKMKFEQGDDGVSFGYKSIGANAVDATGKKDAVEFINIAKDDVLAWPKQVHRAYPETVNAHMASTLSSFTRKSLDINNVLLEILNEKLGLPVGALLEKHRIDEHSGSVSRITRSPPIKADSASPTLGSHTDFGSLSFLHNRLGGLQVLVPGAETWQYVKPIPGHAICNIGDSLSIFSGGILRSNLHRVVPPPGYQSTLERWSLVYFTRPGDSIILRTLVEDSPTIAKAVAKNPERNFETGSTASEWLTRRIKNQRINNRKGPETWMASRGTEVNPAVA